MQKKLYCIGKKSLSLLITVMLVMTTMIAGMVTTQAASSEFKPNSTLYVDVGSTWYNSNSAYYADFKYNPGDISVSGYNKVQLTQVEGSLYSVTVPDNNYVRYVEIGRYYNGVNYNKFGVTASSRTSDSDNKITYYVQEYGVDWSNGTYTWSTYDGGGSDIPAETYYIGGRLQKNWSNGSTNDPKFDGPDEDGVYSYETNKTVAQLSTVWQDSGYTADQYFFIHTGKGTGSHTWYGLTNGLFTDLVKSIVLNDCTNQSTDGNPPNGLVKFNGSSDKKVTLHFNPNTKELSYSVEGDVQITDGQFKITDKTEANGSLSFSVSGKTPGTADAGDTVTVKASANSGYICKGITVNPEVNVTEKGSGVYTFTMPESDVTVSGTFGKDEFANNKLDYIKTQGDGLWIDAAPSVSEATATLIKWNNYEGTNHGTTNPYTFYVPKNVDLKNAHIYNGFSTAVTLCGKSIPADGTAVVSLNIGDNNSDKGNVKVMQGSTDAMFLYTTKKGNEYVLPTQIGAGASKGDVKTDGGVCVTMTNNSSIPEFSKAMELESVKGRGNSSWEASHQVFGKYAYNMKLASKTNLFGMAKDTDKGKGSKSWCLLANNADESMLRNAFIYKLADDIGLYDSPEFRFVDVYDNSRYMGSYLVTEKVDVGGSKLIPGESFDDINEAAAEANAGGEINESTISGTYNYNGNYCEMGYARVLDNGNTSGVPYQTEGKYLLEFEISERYHDEASYFTSPRGQHVVVKSPEFATKEQVEYIAKKFAAMEELAFRNEPSYADLATVMDVDSFAKMYLIQEFSSNLDAASTSYYVTFDCAEENAVFAASPVWDYDWALGQYTNNVYEPKKAVGGETLRTNDPQTWVAKYKSMDDSKGGYAYSLQSQLASQCTAFKSTIRKVWEAEDGFYNNLKNYYGSNSQLDKWRDEIGASVEMNETRWGFIKHNYIADWGSADNAYDFNSAVNWLENSWTSVRANWLNTKFTESAKYPEFQMATPTAKIYDAEGKTEVTEVEAGQQFVVQGSTIDGSVTFRLYKDGVKVSDSKDGKFVVNTDDSMAGKTLTYTVKTVFGSRESASSLPVSVRVAEKSTVETVRVYFKSIEEASYIPSVSVDGNTAVTMIKDDGTYLGSAKFYWFYADVDVDTETEHTVKFTANGNRVNASGTYTFVPETAYYFAVDNLNGDTELVDLTGKAEYIRNYHHSAAHMVNAPNPEDLSESDVKVGFTFIGGKEYAMGVLLDKPVPAGNAFAFSVKSATLAQKITAGFSTVSELQYQLLDMNLDGVVDVRDATMIQKFIAM